MGRTRLEAFSDGVFAIIITIMVLELKVPHGTDWDALRALWPAFSTYALSFVFLGIYWNNHHHLLHTVDRVNGRILWANLHLLFWLSLIPTITGWVGESHFASLPAAVYGAAFLLAAIAYQVLQAAIIASHGAHSRTKAAIGRDVKGKVSGALYLAAIPLAFVHGGISLALYLVVALMWLIPDRRIERTVNASLMIVAAAALAQALPAQAPAQAQAAISASEFAARRDSLAARIDSGVVVAFGGRNLVHDFGTFFQAPAFHYLTNLDEPDAAFVMVVRNKRGASTVFITPINPRTAFYYGQRPDPTTVKASHGIPGRPFADLVPYLDSLAGTKLPFYSLADFEDADFARADSLTRGQLTMKALAAKHPGLVVRDAHPIVNQLRARKSPAELALLRKAAEISSEGHRQAMLVADPKHEYEMRAALEYTFTRLGAERPAYGSIVGTGVNGTQLHYMKDTAAAKPGEVVVIDAAAEYHGYAADITRTIPVSGTYTPEQKQVYQLVLDSQLAAERNSKPGMRASAAEDSSFNVRAKGLAALGLIESEDAMLDPPWNSSCTATDRNCRQAYFWTIHGISHGLGLAVHDPVQASFGDRTYKIGDAFTIEPGVYISTRALGALPDTPRNRAFIAKVRAAVQKYENTGVRIEDDYVITDKGLERISTAPREISEIEALMRRRARVQP